MTAPGSRLRGAASLGAALRGSRRLTAARAVLSELRDPEIPAVGILELGMLHDLREDGEVLVVEILPTFSGCPAIEVITSEVERDLGAAGLGPVRIVTRADLPWSTEMISETGRAQLRDFGIVPPQRHRLTVEEITCPICHQRNVALVSKFGPTPCRATAQCRNCGEPLEVFKPVGTLSLEG
jgi:ring-1,2-phenylacetyl-CoA epoxidase subunit PaaD